MSSSLLFLFVILYFLLLLFVSYKTSRNSNNETFFIGNKSSNWILVAFGMIGTSLSGVTFVSVPGTVGAIGSHGPGGFAYFQVVLGYLIGYLVIAFILLPLYYRLNLTSIYNYLKQRFGSISHKTGASFFILSRILGATARLYLVINVLQLFILDALGIPFWATALIILIMILLYTFKGGVKTIVWTDTLQTTFMLLGLIVCIFYLMQLMGNLSFKEVMTSLNQLKYTGIFNFDYNSPNFFIKQIAGGAFITITMTGMDQEMMQKNISVKNLKDSQKNMVSFSVIIVLVNFLFLFLGGLLYMFAAKNAIMIKGDDLFPTIALHYLPQLVSIIFIIGLISALFPSADGAITALTSSFCIDILGLPDNKTLADNRKMVIRKLVHISFAILFMLSIMIFKWIDNKSVISLILKIAGYTYGPLLGLFSFGMLTKRKVFDKAVPLIALLAPALCFWIDSHQEKLFGAYKIGIELLIINGIITFLGLLIFSKKSLPNTYNL